MLSPSSPGPKRLNKYESNLHKALHGTYQDKTKTFQRKTRRYNVVDRLQRTHGRTPSHRTQGRVNLTCKHAPCAPSPQPKAGVPYGTQQRPEELEVFGSHSGHGSLWPSKKSRRTRPRNSVQEKCSTERHDIIILWFKASE